MHTEEGTRRKKFGGIALRFAQKILLNIAEEQILTGISILTNQDRLFKGGFNIK